MTTMVERVARAMCSTAFPPDEVIYLGGYMKRWESKVDDARDAIKAFMTGTKFLEFGERTVIVNPECAASVWDGVDITVLPADAALKEGGE